MRYLQVSLAVVTASLCYGVSANAANVVWVTPHSPTTTAAVALLGYTAPPDVGYTDLLAGFGHNVTRFLAPAAGANVALTPAALTTLNAADVVIISRSNNSGVFDNAAEFNSWNTAVTKPLINLSGYIARNNRLGFTTGTTIPDINGPTRFVANDTLHPVFNGVPLGSTNETADILGLVTAPVAGNPTQRGTSINTNGIISGTGVTLIASITSDNAAAANGPVIAEFPAGTISSSGGMAFASKRMIFITGSREVDGVNTDTAGIIDLSRTGRRMLLNAVCYMAGNCSVLSGDTDGDGTVELNDDFNPIRDNFRKLSAQRKQGDLNLDGLVDFDDFLEWKGAFLGAGGSLDGVDLSLGSSVPEPATGLLLALGGLAGLGLRRNRRHAL